MVSQSVRTDSAAAEITDITSLDGSEASSQESPLAGMVSMHTLPQTCAVSYCSIA